MGVDEITQVGLRFLYLPFFPPPLPILSHCGLACSEIVRILADLKLFSYWKSYVTMFIRGELMNIGTSFN